MNTDIIIGIFIGFLIMYIFYTLLTAYRTHKLTKETQILTENVQNVNIWANGEFEKIKNDITKNINNIYQQSTRYTDSRIDGLKSTIEGKLARGGIH